MAAPALSVFGVRGASSIPLRQSLDRAPDAILGLSAPSDVEAVIAVASSVIASTGAARHRTAALAVAVSRTGDELCFLADGPDVTETWQPQGWLIDACRRSVGLATRPDDAHPLDLPIAVWLDSLMVATVATATSDWPGAALLCPVPDRWRSLDPIQLGTTLASVTPGWSALRSGAAAGTPIPLPVDPAHAAWMDTPMFTRWCLGFFPDVVELRADVEFLAAPPVAAHVDQTIRAAYSAWIG